jgi:hypothetical protein
MDDVEMSGADPSIQNELFRLLTVGQRQLAVMSFGEDTVRALESNGVITRYIWAPENNDIQCAKSPIGPIEYNKTQCWICGFSIPDVKYPHGLLAECEHVLPIAQAVMILGLYNTRASPEENAAITHLLAMEYRWSHSICNQVKNDDTYYSIKDNTIITDNSKIQSLLNKIYESTRKDSDVLRALITKYPGGFNKWNTDNTKRIAGIYQNILEFLATPVSETPALTMLAWLSSARIVPGSEVIGSLRQRLFNKEGVLGFSGVDEGGITDIANSYSNQLDEIIALYTKNGLGDRVTDIVNKFRSEPETRLSLYARVYKKYGRVFALHILYLVVLTEINKQIPNEPYTIKYMQSIHSYLTNMSTNEEVSSFLKEIFSEDSLLSTLMSNSGGKHRKTFRRKRNGRPSIRSKKRSNRTDSRTYRNRKTSN